MVRRPAGPHEVAATLLAGVASFLMVQALPGALSQPSPGCWEWCGLDAEIARVGLLLVAVFYALAFGVWKQWVPALALAGCATAIVTLITGLLAVLALVSSAGPDFGLGVPLTVIAGAFATMFVAIVLTVRQLRRKPPSQ